MRLLWNGDFSPTHFALNFQDTVTSPLLSCDKAWSSRKTTTFKIISGKMLLRRIKSIKGLSIKSSGNCCVSKRAVAVICNSTVTLTCAIKMTLCVTRLGESHLLHARYFERVASWSQRRALSYKGHRRERTAGFLSCPPLFTFYISSSDMSFYDFFFFSLLFRCCFYHPARFFLLPSGVMNHMACH